VRIETVRHFPQRNIHNHRPVMELDVDLGKWDGVLSSEIDGFCDAVAAALPTLREHHCSRGHPGGFIERLRAGTLLGHVLEHVVLELQALLGYDVIYGKTRRLRGSRYRIVAEYECEEVAEAAARSGLKMMLCMLEEREVDRCSVLRELKRVQARYDLGPSTRALVQAAKRRGVPHFRLNDRSLLQLGYGSEQKRMQATITGDTRCLGVDIASDKALSKKLLEEGGVPVPAGVAVEDADELGEVALQLDGPLAVKPRRGNQGAGVSLGIADFEDLKAAHRLAAEIDSEVIVERFIPGKQYRVLVVADEVVAASLRRPPGIAGDGKSTILQLIEEENSRPDRGEGHESSLTVIPVDQMMVLSLRRRGLSLSFVLPEGRRVRVRDEANLSTGGTAVDVTDHIHPQNASLARRAARITGLDVAGVDIVTDDISRPMNDEGAVIEVNAAPGLRMHLSPTEGRSRDAGLAIVDHLFPRDSSRGRIPIIAVTGSNGKTTVVRLLQHILTEAGYSVGATTTDGVYIGDQRIMRGDSAGPRSARVVLGDPAVEAAVLETARGGMIRSGLFFDCCDVGLVTNITGDHLGQDGVETLDDLVSVKSLVVEAVAPWGRAVLNADDARAIRLAHRCPGESVLFSAQEDNLSLMQHKRTDGAGVYVSGGRLVWARGRRLVSLMHLSDAPLTFAGVAQHNVQNLTGAAAGALALGIPADVVAEALHSFQPAEQNPGRFQVLSIDGRLVVIDYGHNRAGYAATFRALRHLPPDRWHGVIGVPGNRRDQDISEVGREAGRNLHHITIKEDSENPGRTPGEVCQLLLRGVLRAPHPEERTRIVPDEGEAVMRALDDLPRGAGLVVFYEKYKTVYEAVRVWAQDLGEVPEPVVQPKDEPQFSSGRQESRSDERTP